MKAMGTILLLLATVGVLSSWSVLARADDGVVYLVANVLLAATGGVLLIIGTRRRRSAAD